MTDPSSSAGELQEFKNVIRAAVHEMRNALNGIVVNVEVVRTRLARQKAGDASGEVLSFAEQAAQEAENAARINEGMGALMTLIAASLDGKKSLESATHDRGSSVTFYVDQSIAEKVVPPLQVLGERAGFTAELRGGAVIFTIPVRARTDK